VCPHPNPPTRRVCPEERPDAASASEGESKTLLAVFEELKLDFEVENGLLELNLDDPKLKLHCALFVFENNSNDDEFFA
jgi:hypothetical protein